MKNSRIEIEQRFAGGKGGGWAVPSVLGGEYGVFLERGYKCW